MKDLLVNWKDTSQNGMEEQLARGGKHSLRTTKYLIRDRNARYGNVFSSGVKNLGIKQIVTFYCSTWQNGYGVK